MINDICKIKKKDINSQQTDTKIPKQKIYLLKLHTFYSSICFGLFKNLFRISSALS